MNSYCKYIYKLHIFIFCKQLREIHFRHNLLFAMTGLHATSVVKVNFTQDRGVTSCDKRKKCFCSCQWTIGKEQS